MGLKITTDGKPVTVFKNERTTQNGGKFTTYSLAVASKDKDGNWVNGYIDAQFKKNVDVNNKAKINIGNAFYTVNKGKDGKNYIKLFVMEFDVVDQGEVPNAAQASGADFMSIPDGIDEDVPFV